MGCCQPPGPVAICVSNCFSGDKIPDQGTAVRLLPPKASVAIQSSSRNITVPQQARYFRSILAYVCGSANPVIANPLIVYIIL